jgi:hypothetical protein
MFTNAAEGSVYQSLLQNNMDDNSFVTNTEGMRSLLVNQKETRLFNVPKMLNNERYKCKVSSNTF